MDVKRMVQMPFELLRTNRSSNAPMITIGTKARGPK